MKWNMITRLYVTLLFLTFIHFIEEVWGKAWFIESIFGGLLWFFILHIILFTAAMMIFIFFLKGEAWAFALSFVYAGIMIIDGLSHIVDFFRISMYFGGAAGLFTGIGFILVSVFLIRYLYKEKKEI